MLSVLFHANLANLTKFASLHSRIVLRKHSAKPTAASEATQPLRDLRDSRETKIRDERKLCVFREICVRKTSLSQ